MQVTITTPDGAKVRTATARRYVVVYEYQDTGVGEHFAVIDKRTDSLVTARGHVTRSGRYNSGRDWTAVRAIYDTTERRFVD